MKSSWAELQCVEDGLYRIWIKWWHPTFWIETFTFLTATGDSIPAALFYTAVMILLMATRPRS